MADSYVAGDYAGLKTESVEFCYGYEVTEDDEWCFRARIQGQETITIPYPKLGMSDDRSGECAECLLAGIGIVLDRVKLVPKE